MGPPLGVEVLQQDGPIRPGRRRAARALVRKVPLWRPAIGKGHSDGSDSCFPRFDFAEKWPDGHGVCGGDWGEGEGGVRLHAGGKMGGKRYPDGDDARGESSASSSYMPMSASKRPAASASTLSPRRAFIMREA